MGNRTSGRKEIFELLRGPNTLINYTDEFGHQIMLNPVKHFVYQRAYKKDVYNRELIKISQKYAEYLKSKKEENAGAVADVAAQGGVVAEVLN